ncbi:MAG: IclR family transcriptional regulator [Bacillota bacterium]
MGQIEVLRRACLLLSLMTPTLDEKEWSASELARRANLPTATAHRILTNLAKYRLVAQSPESKKFRLGTALIEYGFAVWESLSLRDLARPIMNDLVKETGETVYLIIRDDKYGLLIDKIDSPHSVRFIEPIGVRVPLNVGAGRRTLLAFLPQEISDRIIDDLDFERFTENTICTPEKLREAITKIRVEGYGIGFSELTKDSASIAAPVLSQGGTVIATLALAGPSSRFTSDMIPHFVAAVKKAAAAISEHLGGSPGTLYQDKTPKRPLPPI